MKKQTEQTSRLFYQNLDHKDIAMNASVGGTKKELFFHGALVMKDIDEEGRILLWRKKFKDRYFSYMTKGRYENHGFHGICYINPKVDIGTRYNHNGSALVGNGYKVASEPYVSNVYVTSDDHKTVRYLNLPQAVTRVHGFKNGILCQYYTHPLSFITFKSNELEKDIKELDVYQQVADYEDKWAFLNVIPNGESNLGVIRSSLKDQKISDEVTREAWDVWNSETFQFTTVYIESKKVIADGTRTYYESSFPYIGTNGRQFIVYRAEELDEKGKRVQWWHNLYEINASGIINITRTPKNHENFSSLNSMTMKYSGGRYYIYLTYFPDSYTVKNLIFTSTDASGFTAHQLSDVLWIDYLYQDKLDRFGLLLNGKYREANYFTAKSLEENFPIFEDNKRIKTPTDLAFAQPDNYSGSRDYLIIYLDNYMLAPSGNNFCFFSSDATSNPTPQKMWHKYYNLED